MTHASLFSGIGGPEVAAAMMGWENAFHCEINPFGRAVLEYWFPNSKSYEDITKTDFREWRGKIDILTGGFPCQPFSYAGKRGGREDERYLWPEMLRVIDEVRPTWVVGENVTGITTMVEGGVLTPMGCDTTLFGEGDGLHRYELRQRFTIERICRDLEGLGYSVQPVLIPAAAVGAPHRRDRVFILAHASDTDRRDDVRISGEQGVIRTALNTEVWSRNKLRSEVQGAAKDSVGDGCRLGDDDQQGRVRHVGHVGARDDEWVCGEERVPSSHSLSEGTRSISGSSCDKGRESGEDWGEGIRQAHGTSGSSGAVAAGLHASDPNCGRGGEVSSEIHSGKSDGNKSVSDGSERNVTDAECQRLLLSKQEQQPRSEERIFKGSSGENVESGAITYPNSEGREEPQQSGGREDSEENGTGVDDRTERSGGNGDASDSFRQRFPAALQPGLYGEEERNGARRHAFLTSDDAWLKGTWWDNFPTVSPVHAGNDGLPVPMDRASIPFNKWRTESLKAYGNAIVPQVMYRIFQAIESVEE